MKTILVVDDDAQIREGLAKILRVEGYEVLMASSGHDAKSTYHQANVDLLLLDLNLPQTTGWDLFEWFTSGNPLLPIIIITGRANQSKLARGAGASALMEKPLDVPLLLQTIRELLAEPAENRLKRLVGKKPILRHSTALNISEPGNRRRV